VSLRWLADALSGKVSLSRAFWVRTRDIRCVLLHSITHRRTKPDWRRRLSASGCCSRRFADDNLWRCAYNSRSRFLGRLVRTAMVFGLLVVVVMLYVLLTNTDLLLPPNNRWRGP
jgi:hypothetical protein